MESPLIKIAHFVPIGMSNSHRGHSIDASYQVSVYLAKLCQSRKFLEIVQSEKRVVCGGHGCYQIGTK
jgi:hypothetical protein